MSNRLTMSKCVNKEHYWKQTAEQAEAERDELRELRAVEIGMAKAFLSDLGFPDEENISFTLVRAKVQELKAEVERLQGIIADKAKELKGEGRCVEAETLVTTEIIGRKAQKEGT